MRSSTRRRAAFVVMATLTGVCAPVGALSSRASTTRAAVATTPRTAVALRTGLTPMKAGCANTDPARALSVLRESAATGVSMVRCDLDWWTVQPTGPNSWNWAPYDNVVAAADQLGLEVVFVPQSTPPWARPNPLPAGTTNPSHVPPVHDYDYVRFVRAAARRYAPTSRFRPDGLVGEVHLWEIWNEPNIPGFWNPVDPIRYSALLRRAARAIHGVDPAATVVSGGLAPAVNINGNLSPDVFVYVLALTGTLDEIDGVGMHPYTFWAFPSEQVGWNPIVGQVPAVHDVLATFGHGNLPIWATEAGWPTSSASPHTLRPDGTQVGTEFYQAVATADLLTTWHAIPYSGPLFLYETRDRCSDPRNWLCMLGLERSDGTRKLAFSVLQQLMGVPVG